MRPAPAAELIAWGCCLLPGRAQAPLDARGGAVVPTALDAVEAVDTGDRAVVADGLGVDARLELRPLEYPFEASFKGHWLGIVGPITCRVNLQHGATLDR